MKLSFRLEIPKEGAEWKHAAADKCDFASIPMRFWSAAPRLDLGTRGCIVGLLFRRDPLSSRVTDLSPVNIEEIVNSRGAALLSNYWGGYIALLVDEDGAIAVLRDPSGMMPCYFCRKSGGVAVASDMGALAEPGRANADYAALARMFAGIDAIGRCTGIAGIEELLPGERLIISSARDVRIETAWSPWEHVEPQNQLDFTTAVDALRETLRDCMGAWSNCFGNILVGVSGGLDSSIVAAALRPGTPNVRFLTMIEPGTDGDERRYARVLSERLGRRLDTACYDLNSAHVDRAVLPHLPLPVAAHYFHAIAAEHERINIEWPVDAYFSGNGGDNVFCAMRSAAPLADRFLAGGTLTGLFATARDVADLTGARFTEVLRHGVDRVRRRSGGHRIRCNLAGLGEAGCAAALSGSDRHPWLLAPAHSLPGKTAHIAMLARACRSIELYPRYAASPQISPLLSQPVVELCLSIPTWHWVRGGRDRAVAREAIRDVLPTLIVERRTKGGPTGFVRRIFDAQRDEAIEMLRHGKLVDAGVLESDWLRCATHNSWRDDGRDLRLLSFAAAEAWVRWWEDGGNARH